MSGHVHTVRQSGRRRAATMTETIAKKRLEIRDNIIFDLPCFSNGCQNLALDGSDKTTAGRVYLVGWPRHYCIIVI